MAEGQRKRVRDYSAERARRNAEARLWGFTSLDQMSKARRSGEFPSRRVLLSDPQSGIRAKRKLQEKTLASFNRTAGRREASVASDDAARSPANARAHDRESMNWSDAHSKQSSTKFNPRWSAAKKERYYQTFVRPWGKTRTPEQRESYHVWQTDYSEDYTETDNPYV